jgi:hypothetical protein
MGIADMICLSAVGGLKISNTAFGCDREKPRKKIGLRPALLEDVKVADRLLTFAALIEMFVVFQCVTEPRP